MNTNLFNGMFGKIQPGMCRISMSGGIAVKTSNGYKSYNTKTGRLTNCDSFVFNIGEEFFFVIPTNKVAINDIILVNGKPKCVIKKDKDTITVINYEDSRIDTIVPERHVFMGNFYLYGKIVSMFGNNLFGGKNGGIKNIMKYMVLSQMMGGFTNTTTGTSNNNGMASMLPLMCIGGMMGGGNMLDGMFDFDFGFDSDNDDEEKDDDNKIEKVEEDE